MTKDTVNYKLRVFISSKCDGKYEIVRKALKKLLIETGLVECWCFETEPASSEAMPNMYLNQIKSSQLFILIVDNKDNVSNAVMTEYQRAKELGIRIIAIFCDEDSKEKTEIEKEILQKGNCRYKTANKFSDITGMAYNAVMQDIVNVYMDIPIETEPKTVITIPEIQETLVAQNVTVDKDFYNEFDVTKNAILDLFFHNKEKGIYQPLETDALFYNFIQVILYNKPFDENEFVKLIPNILSRHNETMGKVIEKRLNAVKYYFFGEVDKCVDILNNLVNECKELPIPQWIFNDIAIDLRNMIRQRNLMNGIVDYYNNGQDILNGNKEFVYFPALDRIASDIKNNTIKEYGKIAFQSPYVKSFGGVESLFADITSYYCTALLYGSVTHLIITRSLLVEILQVLSQEYVNQEFNMQLIRFLILEHNDKILSNYVRIYDKQCDIINSIEIENIITGISFLPTEYDRNYASLLLLKYFGYYMSDEQFKKQSEWFIAFSYSWINDKKRLFNFADEIKNVYCACCERFDSDKIFNFIIKLFNSKNYILINNACELIGFVRINELSSQKQNRIAKHLEKLVESDYSRKNVGKLKKALVYFSLKSNMNLSSLTKAIEENMPSFFNNAYHLEVYDRDKHSLLKQIDKYIESIKNRIEIQGKNGSYTGFIDRPFETISNIITHNDLKLSWKEIKPIVDVTIEFILSPNQSCSEKQQAITLITTLLLIYSKIGKLREVVSSIILQKEQVLKINSVSIFDSTNVKRLLVSWTCLGFLVGQTDSHNVISCIASIITMDDTDIINCLNYLSKFLKNAQINDLPNEILSSFLQLALSLLGNKEKDIKYLAVNCLIELTHSDYQDIALNQLSLCMDIGIPDIRILIIDRIKQINGNQSSKDYIKQKALIDKHYLVRKLTEKIE